MVAFKKCLLNDRTGIEPRRRAPSPHPVLLVHACPGCGKAYKWKRNLRRHQLQECGQVARYECPYCHYMSKHKSDLRRHCGRRHAEVIAAQQEMAELGVTPTPPPPDPLSVAPEPADRSDPMDAVDAGAEVHGDDLPRPTYSRASRRREAAFPCRECGKAYQHRKNLLRHLRLECGKAPTNFCPYCPYSSKQPYNLTLHIRFKHSTPSFPPPGSYDEMSDEGYTREVHACPNCRKVYRWKKGLERHLLECGQEPRLSCSFCDYRCKRKDSLAKHMRRRHADVSDPDDSQGGFLDS
ncbi:Zinc finger protein 425 [Frankliniella fusca]|uniref:Zinc finger protein 425 n=1 Tax=Frankliniella fusca TaxID=407009 RepID=A0AAE1H629_9NEOP|nr:Zinc finger protein 425 [Frankliniella fusca]